MQLFYIVGVKTKLSDYGKIKSLLYWEDGEKLLEKLQLNSRYVPDTLYILY